VARVIAGAVLAYAVGHVRGTVGDTCTVRLRVCGMSVGVGDRGHDDRAGGPVRPWWRDIVHHRVQVDDPASAIAGEQPALHVARRADPYSSPRKRNPARALGIQVTSSGHPYDMKRGQLRIYLGAAPGVGKTYAMLGEGHRRLARGTDVVVGFAETYNRKLTAQLLEGLEIVSRRVMTYRGSTFEEMDVDAVLARKPEVALVDELAHTNIPGSRNAKRWQDVDELLTAGINVISTVNIQHLESVNDVVEKITGAPQRETIPDAVVRAAEQIEMVDMTPEALRRRMVHGNVYAPEKIDAALSNYFRLGNLTALRELALLWVADRVEEGLLKYRAEHGIGQTWEARERVVIALTGGPEGETLIRRAARIASRTVGGDLLAVHVARSDGLTGASPAALAGQRRLVESLGGSYHQVIGDDISEALLAFARAENATQLVLGASRRSWLATMLTGPGIGSKTIHASGDIDVHIITHDEMGRRGGLPRPTGSVSLNRRIYGFALAAAASPLLTIGLASARGGLNLLSDALVFLVLVVLVALVGGLYPALFAAIATSLLLNYYFIPPLHAFTIEQANNVLALVVFVAVAVAVSAVVDLAARRTRQAARANAQSETLATMAGSVLRGESGVNALLERVRESFGMTSATLLQRSTDVTDTGSRGPAYTWAMVGSAGPAPPSRPEDADVDVDVGDGFCLALRGHPLPADERGILGAFAVQAAVTVEQRRLAEAAAAAKPTAEADKMRAALLATAGHDMRTPLAAAKAAVGGLGASDVTWKPEQVREVAASAYASLDQLTRLVDNLLDLSRLQAGVLSLHSGPTDVADVVAHALASLGPQAAKIKVVIPAGTPLAVADPALLERVLVNLLSNAVRYSPADSPTTVTAGTLGDRVELRVIDQGPGVSQTDRDRIFAPSHRLGGENGPAGTGLGLAQSRALTEAMQGTLTPEDTPGGGLTMIVSLPAAGSAPARAVPPAPFPA
jgi:two-component system, OmpR family, sensor histidine kinase KdpD